jgi:glycosyltransferase involved in cell wall biosynthesis
MSFSDTVNALDHRQVSAAPDQHDLSVIIPAFNEQKSVRATVQRVRAALNEKDYTFEIVVVDDGSTDGTAAEAEASGARVIRLPSNRGYGGALKAGINQSRSDYVAIIDADGTYPEDAIDKLLTMTLEADMAVGVRAINSPGIPSVRRFPKQLLNWLASYLSGVKITDVNSGVRVMRRSTMMKFLPILPSGFSFTTTITLAMICSEHRVVFAPIEYRKRIGTSKIRPFDFVNFLVLILRTIVLFNPLKIFLPLGSFLFVAGAGKLINDIFYWDLSESAVMGMLSAILVWSFGLLADVLARLYLYSGRV